MKVAARIGSANALVIRFIVAPYTSIPLTRVLLPARNHTSLVLLYIHVVNKAALSADDIPGLAVKMGSPYAYSMPTLTDLTVLTERLITAIPDLNLEGD